MIYMICAGRWDISLRLELVKVGVSSFALAAGESPGEEFRLSDLRVRC